MTVTRLAVSTVTYPYSSAVLVADIAALFGLCPFSECMLVGGAAVLLPLVKRSWWQLCFQHQKLAFLVRRGFQGHNPPDLKISYNSVMVLLPSRLSDPSVASSRGFLRGGQESLF